MPLNLFFVLSCTLLVFDLQVVNAAFSRGFLPLESFVSDSEKDTDSAEHHTWSKVIRPGFVEKRKPPMISLLSVSLEDFGAQTMHSNISVSAGTFTVAQPQGAKAVSGDGQFAQTLRDDDSSHLNPLAVMPHPANMFDARALQPQIEPLNFNQLSHQSKSNLLHMAVLIGGLFFFLVLAYFLVFFCSEVSEVDYVQVEAPVKSAKAEPTDPAMSQSSWARAYLEAEGDQKDAFELLFRCNIISTEEFACSVISQEHIQECTWIAMHMLQHRPLEEWVALWQQAQQTFEDSVAECFEARGGQIGFTARSLAQRLKISRNQYMPPTSPGQTNSMPSSANLDFVSQSSSHDFRPLHS